MSAAPPGRILPPFLIGIGPIGLALIGGGAAAVGFSAIRWTKQSDAFAAAMARVRAAPAVTSAIGAPVTDGRFVSGTISSSSSSNAPELARGSASLTIPISGPIARATLKIEAEKARDTWHFHRLVVEVEKSGPRIDLPEKRPDAATPAEK